MSLANYDLPNEKIKEVMRLADAKTKREAIIIALEDYIKRKKLETLASELAGDIQLSWTQKSLKKFRKARKY